MFPGGALGCGRAGRCWVEHTSGVLGRAHFWGVREGGGGVASGSMCLLFLSRLDPLLCLWATTDKQLWSFVASCCPCWDSAAHWVLLPWAKSFSTFPSLKSWPKAAVLPREESCGAQSLSSKILRTLRDTVCHSGICKNYVHVEMRRKSNHDGGWVAFAVVPRSLRRF